MDANFSIFIDYDNTLIGRKNKIGPEYFFGIDNPNANHRQAINLIRYVIEFVLGWNFDEAYHMFDSYIYKLMKLDMLDDYLLWPDDILPGDTKYLLSIIYPGKIKLDAKQVIFDTYKRVLEENKQFPREYFTGTNGFYRYCTCLSYIFNYVRPFHSIPEMYEFMDSPEGKVFLMDYRLKIPADHLSIDIYKCLYAINQSEDSRLYYLFYCFYRELDLLDRKKSHQSSNEHF